MSASPDPATAELSVTIAPLMVGSGPDAIRRAWNMAADLGIRYVQIAATMSGLRPRDLDRSARRDVVSSLRRRGLEMSGIDLWIPSTHFTDPSRADRAMSALAATIILAADMGRVPLSVTLPTDEHIDASIINTADRYGVRIADHSIERFNTEYASHVLGLGIDPAVWLADGRDPVQAVHLAGARLVCARLVDVSPTGAREPIRIDGGGRLDVQAYRVALSVSGCRSPVIIDARQWMDAVAGIQATLARWQRL